MKGYERARLNLLQALQDLGATSALAAVRAKDVDLVVGDLSRYARSNTKIVQSLHRDNLIGIDLNHPMRLWLTLTGSTYLINESN